MTTTPAATAALHAGYFHEAHPAVREVVGGLTPALFDWRLGQEMNSIAALIAHTLDSERGLVAIVAGFMLPRDRDAALRVAALIADDVVTMIDAAERDVDGFLNPNRGSFGRSNRAPDADGKWRVGGCSGRPCGAGSTSARPR
ncbi:MAG: DinB family protein [Candidatus Limnocylindrales bacterium]